MTKKASRVTYVLMAKIGNRWRAYSRYDDGSPEPVSLEHSSVWLWSNADQAKKDAAEITAAYPAHTWKAYPWPRAVALYEGTKYNPAARRVGTSITAPSMITRRRPSKRLIARRRKNVRRGFYPNPKGRGDWAIYGTNGDRTFWYKGRDKRKTDDLASTRDPNEAQRFTRPGVTKTIAELRARMPWITWSATAWEGTDNVAKRNPGRRVGAARVRSGFPSRPVGYAVARGAAKRTTYHLYARGPSGFFKLTHRDEKAGTTLWRRVELNVPAWGFSRAKAFALAKRLAINVHGKGALRVAVVSSDTPLADVKAALA